MPIVMSMNWPEVTPEQYEKVRDDVAWETDVPEGARLHVAWFSPSSGFHVIDVWDSPSHFDHFATQRLTPATQSANISTAPVVEISDAHAIFAPNPSM